MNLPQPAARNLFYPATQPTRRRQWRMPWTSLVGILSAIVSVWMIWQVNDIYRTRQKKRLQEIYAPQPQETRATEPARELVKSPPALTELRFASSRRP